MADTKTVRIPTRIWGRIASEADHRGTTVEDLLVASILQIVYKKHRHATVIGLAALGHADRAIAELTGETLQFVREARALTADAA